MEDFIHKEVSIYLCHLATQARGFTPSSIQTPLLTSPGSGLCQRSSPYQRHGGTECICHAVQWILSTSTPATSDRQSSNILIDSEYCVRVSADYLLGSSPVPHLGMSHWIRTKCEFPLRPAKITSANTPGSAGIAEKPLSDSVLLVPGVFPTRYYVWPISICVPKSGHYSIR